MPKLPAKRNPPPDVPTVPIAVMLALASAFAFFGLLSMILPGVGVMALALLLLGVVFWLQYLVWGKWLYGVAVRMEDKAVAAERRAEDRADAGEHGSSERESD